MSNIELRAPRRRPQKEKDQLLPIFCAVVAIGVAGFMFLKTANQEEPTPDIPTTAAQNSNPKPGSNTPAPVPPQPRYQSAPQNRITTESGKTYYVPESAPRYRNSNEPTAEDEYRRASEIMAQSRQVQRNMDSRMYGGNGVITPSSSPSSYECKSIKKAKADLDERMRRYGYDNITAEQLHEEWRQLNKAMIQFQCH